jgi:hypothetical protein
MVGPAYWGAARITTLLVALMRSGSPVTVLSVIPEQVFAALEADRSSGVLVDSVSSSPVRYQTCSSRPGYVERLDRDGMVNP